MNKLTYYLFFSLVIISCGSKKEKSETADKQESQTAEEHVAELSLEKLWETDTLLTTCESVYYDKVRNVLYVSNIDGVPTEKDGNGFISKVNLDGSIENLQWVTGLDAPKGMGVAGDKLYVTNIDELVEVDIISGEIVKRHPVEGALFLNDVATDGNEVYFTDSDTNKIHLLSEGKITTWLASDLKGPNGLFIESDRILLASMGSADLKAISKNDKSQKVIGTEIGAGDGIGKTTGDDYIVSNWRGEVYLMAPDEKKIKLLDTKAQKLNTADIEFIADKNMLLIPTFFGNTVAAYKLK